MKRHKSLKERITGKAGKSIDLDQVIRFFLNLYQLQLGVSYVDADRVESRATPLPPGPTGTDAAYELRVKHQNQRKTRRMTIGLISGSSGSKSTCFKVTYDDLLVVKIPPRPITDFQQYVQSINFEQRIANLLQPEIACITPSVSAILNRIPQFYDRDGLDPDILEKRYLARLEKFPRLQKYLMIGNSFAFFMNLSRHMFVSNAIRRLHDVDTAMQDEIASNTDALWSLEAFHERYGMENTPAFFHVNEVLTACDQAVTPLLEQHDGVEGVPAYTRRQWLLNHLADVPIEKSELNLPDIFFSELHAVLQKVLNSRDEAVNSFRETVRVYIQNKKLNQNIKHFSGLITNLLDLLARLKEKQVAIRDLKPENIFVFTDSQQSSPMPVSADTYQLGLIDFETAVNLKPHNALAVSQPMLAGTPYYATPASIFDNGVLDRLYPDLLQILRIQDWYSVMAVLYEVVVGKHLFEKTGRMVPKIIQIKQKKIADGVAPGKVYAIASRLFWETAEKEFRRKVNDHRKNLDTIRPIYTRMATDMLLEEVKLCSNQVRTVICQRIDTQRMFDSSGSRNRLYEASAAGIKRLRHRWISGRNAAPATRAGRIRTIQFLKELESDKTVLENLQIIQGLRMRIPLKLSVFDVLEIMFYLVSVRLSRFSTPAVGQKNRQTD